MIFFGSRRNNTVMGQRQFVCGGCRQQAYHTVVRSRHWFTLYFIPLIPTGQTTILTCNLCGYRCTIDNAQADMWFQEGQRGAYGQRGFDLRHELTITPEEAASGCQKEIVLSRWEACPACRGSGHVLTTRCEKCGGQGRVRCNRHVVVNIPAGMETGIHVRVFGEGEESIPVGAPGNLYVALTVKPR